MFFKSPHFLCIAAAVSGSILNPHTAANRIARIILKASSENLSSALPTQRIMPLSKSSLPPNRSITPLLSLYAIAFTVKSRRFKSSATADTNSM